MNCGRVYREGEKANELECGDDGQNGGQEDDGERIDFDGGCV